MMNPDNQEMNAIVRTLPIDRAIPNGLDVNDFIVLMREYQKGGDYADICDSLGDRSRALADHAIQQGHLMTATTFYLNAVAAYRVGQYTIIPDTDKKLRMYRKLIDCYSEAAKLYNPEIERIEVPYKDSKMAGWLRMPQKTAGKVPVVISIGGADGWREEHHNYSSYYAERGLAYLMIDGPGQGETRLFNKMYMELNNEEALNEIIEHVSMDNRFGKIGMVGYSFGGYLVARTAGISKKLDACIINGGSYFPKEVIKFIPHFSKVFSALSNKKGTELEKFIDNMTMEGHASNITCSLLVNHGIPDPLFSAEGVEQIYNEAQSTDKTLKLWKDGNHCVTNHATETITMFADFFMDRLK
ncbi:alpha/beta hydrolase family protein [Paenibacillus zanthoxyli]|uniref:alpha/beta hydrolase family protein n=1 Tax=Paenibacillus zanthoxyli TaxID=369399 RepID=UPI0004B2D1FF|nr:alpha/beta hydrolase [Paenibacillus zanthoxyli]